MGSMLGRRLAGMFACLGLVFAGVASAQQPGFGPRPTQPIYGVPGGPGMNPGYRPGVPTQPIYNPGPGYRPGMPGVPGYRPMPPRPVYPSQPIYNPGPRPMPLPGVGVVPPPMVPPQQANYSDLAKHWERVNELVGKFLVELKGTTNLQVTSAQFNLSVNTFDPNILWTAEAIADRKLQITKSWARALELNADASWQIFKSQKNVCDVACVQSFLNLLATMSNTFFFAHNYDMYLRWEYAQSIALNGGQDIINRSWPILDGHLRAMARYSKEIAAEIRFIELLPITQDGFRVFYGLFPRPICAWTYGQPFFPWMWQRAYFAQTYFPYYEMNNERYFVYQAALPQVPQQYLPQGYAAPMQANQFYSNNYGYMAGTNTPSVGAPVGESYQAQGEWVQQQNQYFQQNPVQGGTAPQMGADQWIQQQEMQRQQQLQQNGQGGQMIAPAQGIQQGQNGPQGGVAGGVPQGGQVGPQGGVAGGVPQGGQVGPQGGVAGGLPQGQQTAPQGGPALLPPRQQGGVPGVQQQNAPVQQQTAPLNNGTKNNEWDF